MPLLSSPPNPTQANDIIHRACGTISATATTTQPSTLTTPYHPKPANPLDTDAQPHNAAAESAGPPKICLLAADFFSHQAAIQNTLRRDGHRTHASLIPQCCNAENATRQDATQAAPLELQRFAVH
ncbi:hypothetical protein LZ757_10645 [Xylella fastidiosa subsp. morus]|uniref:hypothetical protein n=1 Tax=Xylella fastidiosa TaxID=2371 RepID=UPI0003ED0E5F|nr:hypothetical protein [Xylella fastidiosa]EWG14870.1 hypothetical protein P910_001950 [Xylella fastidiosa Mul-MD]UIN26944.1 hypothetical protein IUD23_06275 [Xylella fastidiosa subsp. morus]UIT36470.1 hypothetical protein LZ757_10645 [Xylella fastidiosa subsp. morus]UIT38760.1 hypothetical protein LZ755_10675 [Xylella fastidiosa subsp. morus]UIT43203.1 hypothetical protein LZ758_10670 [Xylella fastidiosa subsp. morus]